MFFNYRVSFLSNACFVSILRYLDEKKYDKLDELYDIIKLIRKKKHIFWKELHENFSKNYSTFLKYKEIVLLSLKFGDTTGVYCYRIFENLLDSKKDLSDSNVYSQHLIAFEKVSSLRKSLQFPIMKLFYKYYFVITKLYKNFEGEMFFYFYYIFLCFIL